MNYSFPNSYKNMTPDYFKGIMKDCSCGGRPVIILDDGKIKAQCTKCNMCTQRHDNYTIEYGSWFFSALYFVIEDWNKIAEKAKEKERGE